MASRGGYGTGTRSYSGWQVLLMVLLLGALLGGWIGEALVYFIPVLAQIGRDYVVGIPRFTLDLKVISLLFGLTLRINLFSLLGMVGGFLVYRKM